MMYDPKSISSRSKIFENDKVTDLVDNDLWFPAFEMKNLQGTRDINNMNIEILPNGKIIYTERFYGTFNSDMNYKKFPFDEQVFNIVIEFFSYDKSVIVFSKPQFFPIKDESQGLFDKWVVQKMGSYLVDVEYDELEESGLQKSVYSRAVFEIVVKRLAGYFVWQVIFPLVLIILSSFLIFWIKDFSTQMGIGFTLMLTVVAFNFFSASILPELPYNTYIETIIMAGYSFIFLTIIAAIVHNSVNEIRGDKKVLELNQYLKYIFPISYVITMLLLTYQFYHN